MDGNELQAYKINTRNYAPQELEFYRVGAYIYDSIDTSTTHKFPRSAVLGKAARMTYPGKKTTHIVALPTNFLNEGHIGY